MSIGFTVIEDSIVIARHKAVFKQLKAYRRDGGMYANVSGGFVRLREDGGTTHPNITWDEIEIGDKVIQRIDRSGKYMEAPNGTD